MSEVLLFTTPNVEGMPIIKYFDVISANQVAGTGFLTDLTASFSDLFGGNSGAYRDSMDKLCHDVTVRIKRKAFELGANAVVGVSIDYDSISAKGMSMFMVSIQGTAVKLKIPTEGVTGSLKNEISRDALNQVYYSKRICRKINQDLPLDKDEWTFALKHPGKSLADSLYCYYLKCVKARYSGGTTKSSSAFVDTSIPQWVRPGIDNYKIYLSSLSYEDAVEYAYRDVSSFMEIINSKKLFNAKKILEIAMSGDLETAISLLATEKNSYNSEDLADMKSLSEYLLNLPETGRKEEIKGGLFSSSGLKFVCSCGCKNDPSVEYCTQCGKNIQGINREQKMQIDAFAELVDALSELIK